MADSSIRFNVRIQSGDTGTRIEVLEDQNAASGLLIAFGGGLTGLIGGMITAAAIGAGPGLLTAGTLVAATGLGVAGARALGARMARSGRARTEALIEALSSAARSMASGDDDTQQGE